MTPKQLKAQTERNIESVVTAARKAAEAIGGRFGDNDNYMIEKAGEIQNMVEDWAKNMHVYMKDALAEQWWDESRFDGLGL